jgi:protein TonB
MTSRVWIAMRLIGLPLVLGLTVGCARASDEIAQPAAYVKAPAPDYPSFARRHDIEGTVVLDVRVMADGSPGEVKVSKSSGNALLDAAAIESAKKAEFRPARTKSGDDVESWVRLPIKFVLR